MIRELRYVNSRGEEIGAMATHVQVFKEAL